MDTKPRTWQKAYIHSQAWGEQHVSGKNISKQLLRNKLQKTCKNCPNTCPFAKVKHLDWGSKRLVLLLIQGPNGKRTCAGRCFLFWQTVCVHTKSSWARTHWFLTCAQAVLISYAVDLMCSSQTSVCVLWRAVCAFCFWEVDSCWLTCRQANKTGPVANPSLRSAAVGFPRRSAHDVKSSTSSISWKEINIQIFKTSFIFNRN